MWGGGGQLCECARAHATAIGLRARVAQDRVSMGLWVLGEIGKNRGIRTSRIKTFAWSCARRSRHCQLGSLLAGRPGRTHSEAGGGGGDSVALLRDALVKDFLPTRTPLLPHIRARSHAHASTQARKRASTQARKHASTQACKHASTLTDTWAGMCACAERRRRLAAVPSFTLISSLSRPSQERRKAAAAAAAATAASTAAAQLPQPPVPPPLLLLLLQ